VFHSRLKAVMAQQKVHYLCTGHDHLGHGNEVLRQEDDGEEKMMNCMSTQREGKWLTYIRKREKVNCMSTAKAGAQSRVPMLSPSSQHGGR
jgi:hypothetical protein